MDLSSKGKPEPGQSAAVSLALDTESSGASISHLLSGGGSFLEVPEIAQHGLCYCSF